MAHSRAMCPRPRAPSSSTRYRVRSSARSTVSGCPSSLLNEPGATVGPSRSVTWASRSFVVVLPDEPVIPAIVSPGKAVDHRAGQQRQRGLHVGDDERGHAGRLAGQHSDRPGRHRSGGEIVPVHPLARQRGEQAARLGLPGVDDDRAGHRGLRVGSPVERSPGDLRDLG